MKRAIVYFVVVVLLITFVPRIFASSDEIQLLTASEQRALDAELQRISDKYDFQVVIETIERPENYSIVSTADAIYRERYGNKDGIMLTIATETRDWNISAQGSGGSIFFAEAREYIADRILSDLSAGDLYDAYCLFAELCEDFLQKAETETRDNLPAKPLSTVATVIAIGAGVLIALFVVFGMKSQLKSVAPKPSAADYVRRGSLKIHKSRDVFLFRNVTKVTRSSSSGGRSGGSRSSGRHTSGKF